MKYLFCILISIVMITSCYSSRVLNGNVSSYEPLVEVKAKKNHFLFWGLIPLGEPQKAGDHIGDMQNYVTEIEWSFSDCLLNSITFGIYSPTTTTYYLPFFEGKER